MTHTKLSSPKSLPGKVAGMLRERIRSGYYQAGDRLPAERVLEEDLSVDRRVVRAAIAELDKEGLLIRRPNCRPIVQVLPPQASEADESRSVSQFPSSRLVALVMWHGGPGDDAGTAQQRIFWGMNQALGQAGYHGVFLDLGEEVGNEEQNAEREAMHLRYALDHGFGGILFYAYANNSNRELIQEVSRRMPLVLIDRMVPGVESDFVGSENRRSMYDATKHLIGLGHERIAYVTKGDSINTVHERQVGYLDAMRKTFGSHANEMVITAPAPDNDSWTVFDAVFGLPKQQRPTAVLCVNDDEAVRVAKRLSEVGLSVPGDVSLMGFDNIVRTLPTGASFTTVAQPFEDIGKAATKLFLRRMTDPNALPIHIELPTEMIARHSVKSLIDGD